MKLRAHIGQREEGATVDACLTVDVDDSIVTPQTRLQDALKQKIPVQDVCVGRVGGVEANIAAGVLGPKPLRTVLCKGAVDDVRDSPFIHEAGRQKGSRSDENPGMEVGRGLSKVLWYGDQHCLKDGLRF
jgi:hypothetical protein